MLFLLTNPLSAGDACQKSRLPLPRWMFSRLCTLASDAMGMDGTTESLGGLLCTPPATKLGRGESFEWIKDCCFELAWTGLFIPKNESDVVTESNRKTTEAS